MLKNSILANWRTDIKGNAQVIRELADTDYPAWTVNFDGTYGVAIPYEGNEEINECFAGAKIRSTKLGFGEGNVHNLLMLTTVSDEIKDLFATLCEALIEPGENGNHRILVTSSPLDWWKGWKELLGNRNVDDKIYDVLGELCVLKRIVENGYEAEWNGPEGASYDIETENLFIEVKSSTNRERREITISSQFQLFPSEKPLKLVFCCFEPTHLTGYSIDGIIQDFESKGYNTELLNRKLALKGFEKGMSSRKKSFILHEMLLFTVDNSFPRITPASFVGGVMPAGITDISYTVDLSGMMPISLLGSVANDI